MHLQPPFFKIFRGGMPPDPPSKLRAIGTRIRDVGKSPQKSAKVREIKVGFFFFENVATMNNEIIQIKSTLKC